MEGPHPAFDVSDAMRARGRQVRAYTFPQNREDIAALRVIVRRGVTHDLGDMLIAHLTRALEVADSRDGPRHDHETAGGFRH
jgi:glutamate decarboxylase